jgi:hypothetical protein
VAFVLIIAGLLFLVAIPITLLVNPPNAWLQKRLNRK